MKIFFGKISAKVDVHQITYGYYSSKKDSTWFNGIDFGDYVFLIGGGKIQLWKAREWVLAKTKDEVDRLNFDILIDDIGIPLKRFVGLRFFYLTSELIVKTARSTASEKKAFFPISYNEKLTEEVLLNPMTYTNPINFREIFVMDTKEELGKDKYNIQFYFKDGLLRLDTIENSDKELLGKFKDNLQYQGKGQRNKDKTLATISTKANHNKSISHKISIQNLYDAFMCTYKVTNLGTQYWVVNGFEKEKIDYCLENNLHIMQYQYHDQDNGAVTRQLKGAVEIKEGDKVLLYNNNRYYAHGIFVKADVPSTKTASLKKQIEKGLVNSENEVVAYTDAPCYYEDTTLENGFNGKFGQRLCIEEWEDFHENGIYITGISKHIGMNTNTILKLDSDVFYNKVKKELSTKTKGIEGNELLENCVKILNYKKQIILQGPPGTGKTYTAKDIAEYFIHSEISIDKDEQKDNLENTDQFELIQFHPSYTYEDFVRGISVRNDGDKIAYFTENKTLAKFAELADAELLKKEPKKYVLIIDEINRANLPSVLGELIYALEYRGKKVNSMYTLKGKGNEITLPENLYIIGTMNTADRSVGHIDYAIRRRFAFVDVLPDIAVLENKNEAAKELFNKVAALFVNKETKENSKFLASDFDYKDVQLGHSYFILKERNEEEQKAELKMRWQYEILPILNEYVKDGLLLETAKDEIKKIAHFVK